MASDRRKPRGLTVVPPGREAAFLAPFDVRLLPGVGPRSETRLRVSGISTIGELATLPDGELARLLPGKIGRLLRDRARGIDPRPLETEVALSALAGLAVVAALAAGPVLGVVAMRRHRQKKDMTRSVAAR